MKENAGHRGSDEVAPLSVQKVRGFNPSGRAPTQLMKDLGYGRDYKYPHDFPNHFVDETYLPENLKGRKYYQPTDFGFEKEIKKRLEWWNKKRSQGSKSKGQDDEGKKS